MKAPIASRASICLIIIASLACNGLVAQNSNQRRVKEEAILIPQGAAVEARMLDGQKLRGRIGPVSDQGLMLRSVFGEKIEQRTVNFADIKSVRYFNPIAPRIIASYIITGAALAATIAIAATR